MPKCLVQPADVAVVRGVEFVVRRSRITQCQMWIDGAAIVRIVACVELLIRPQCSILTTRREIPVMIKRRAWEGRSIGNINIHHGRCSVMGRVGSKLDAV